MVEAVGAPDAARKYAKDYITPGTVGSHMVTVVEVDMSNPRIFRVGLQINLGEQ